MEIDLSKCELSDNQDGTKRIYRDFGNGYSAIYHRCVINEETGEVDNKKYGFSVIEDSGWEDDGRGKYYFKNTTYVLVLYSDSWKVIEKYNVIAEQGISRTGSYYTDWNYEYDEPTFKYAYEQLIPEQIIPAHTIIGLKDIDM